jgi:hypothetical protein
LALATLFSAREVNAKRISDTKWLEYTGMVSRKKAVSNSQPKMHASFNERAIETSIWAATRASRARELGLEWLALGLALAGGHLLFVVLPRTTLTFVDLFIVILTLGGGLIMFRFELHRGLAYRDLSQRLQKAGADGER